MTTCENCGCAVYELGCVNCDEENYIEQQEVRNKMYEENEEMTPPLPNQLHIDKSCGIPYNK